MLFQATFLLLTHWTKCGMFINVKIIFDREIMKEAYKVENNEEIHKVLADKIKDINQIMPKYKAIRGMIISEEPLIKTTTNKIKRQANLDAINK